SALRDHGMEVIYTGRLVQPGVDHLHAVVAQRARHRLRAAVVPVESGLADEDADLAVAHAVTSLRRRCSAAPNHQQPQAPSASRSPPPARADVETGVKSAPIDTT